MKIKRKEVVKIVKDNLRRIRCRAGMTQAQLAAAVGVKQASVAFWENGATTPLESSITAICAALNCTADELLGIPPPVANGCARQLKMRGA